MSDTDQRNVTGTQIPPGGRVLGVDLGAAHIGVAVSDGAQRVATGATRIDDGGDRDAVHRGLVGLVADYDAVGVVVGLPLSLSGAAGPAAAGVLDEVAVLRAALRVPVETIDERFSTVSAAAGLRVAGRRGTGRGAGRRARAVVDQTAAAVFLQVWLDRRKRGARG